VPSSPLSPPSVAYFFLFAPALPLFGADVDAFLFFAVAALPAFVQVVSALGLCTGWFVMMNSLSGSGSTAIEKFDVWVS
jgi:hypothetical protein